MKPCNDYPISFAYKAQDGKYYGTNGSVGLYHRGEDRACPTGSPIIVQGVTIGLVGATGLASGPHLHFQCMNGTTDKDPAPYRWAGGTVTTAGWHTQFGNQVRITHADGMVMIYAHLSKINVTVGQKIGGSMAETINDDVARQIGWHYLGRNGYDGKPNALQSSQNDIKGKPLTNAQLSTFFLSAEARDWRDSRIHKVYAERDALKSQNANLVAERDRLAVSNTELTKTIGAPTLTVDSLADWPTDTAVHFTMFEIDANNAEVANTRTDWKAIKTGATTLGTLTLQAGTDREYPIGSKVICAPTAAWADDLIEGLLVSHDQDGTLKADSVDVTAVIKDSIITPAKLDSTFKQGWFSGELPAVSSVTHNGNRSYDVVFGSTVASTLTPGMRLELTKTVAGNGYMGGAFNGSSHYFTKTSPSGTLGTVTNNFTIEAVVQPTSYATGYVCGRMDATPANGWGVFMESDGRITIQVFNAGNANFRKISTYQSLPLNKKTHVAVSWNGTGPAIVIYFDGIAVPAYQSGVGGTNPTTAGTGGDFSIGRPGAYASFYFPGYISNVAVFDAVLSAATIRQHATYKLTGSETNCIGAWSLDNTANDQFGANNLTATGGVGFTAQTPHGQLDSGVQTTKAVGLVMKVNGTDVTVQVPEGVTIPTTGGITSVAYSTQANPYGFVSDKGRWAVESLLRTDIGGTSASTSWFYPGTFGVYIPVGTWNISYLIGVRCAASTNSYITNTTGLSTSSSGAANIANSYSYNGIDYGTSTTHSLEGCITNTMTDYRQTTGGQVYLGGSASFNGTVINNGFYGSTSSGKLKLIPSNL